MRLQPGTVTASSVDSKTRTMWSGWVESAGRDESGGLHAVSVAPAADVSIRISARPLEYKPCPDATRVVVGTPCPSPPPPTCPSGSQLGSDGKCYKPCPEGTTVVVGTPCPPPKPPPTVGCPDGSRAARAADLRAAAVLPVGRVPAGTVSSSPTPVGRGIARSRSRSPGRFQSPCQACRSRGRAASRRSPIRTPGS
jgi:hypothetical protein